MSSSFKDIESRAINLLKNSQSTYWHYSRKDSEDILLYTEKSSIYEAPTKEKFREGSDVLVRWTDGLLYLGNIIKVDDEYSRCAVKFEDGSQYWALYKDIHKGPPPNNEVICTVCDSGTSDPPDEIVICDKCSVGYHQFCHVPKIDCSVLKLNVEWICRKCIFACVAKKGGAVKKGPKAQTMLNMKQVLPYDLNSLTWDAQHRSNFQQTYCYCSGPGEWYMKMLQCLRCKQWFHEACLQCLEEPLLYGDRFYIFVCAVCNKGPEYLRRLSLRWQDIAHLVLFNLTIIHGRKYFELDTTIMHFLKDKWSQLQVKGEELSRSSIDDKKQKMLETLKGSKSRFKSGKEVKRKTTVWGLLSRVPPPVPVVALPDAVPITDNVIDSFLSGKKSKNANRVERKRAPVKKARKIVLPPDSYDTSSQNSVVQVEKDELEEKPPARKEETRKWHKRRLRPRSARKFSLSSAISHSDISDSEDTSSSHGTLNSIIPQPNNFDGPNNPFLSSEPQPASSSKSSSSSSAASTASSGECRSLRKRTRKHRHPQNSRTTRSSSNKHCLINSLIGSPHFSKEPDPKFLINQDRETSASDLNLRELNSSMNSYFGAENRIAGGEKFAVLAKRIDAHGRVQYLIEWESLSS